MSRPLSSSHGLLRLTAAAVVLATLAGCNTTYLVAGSAAAVTLGPSVVTGRNPFYLMDKYFGRSCADYTYFDRPVRCANDNG